MDAANEYGPFGEKTKLVVGAVSAMNGHGVAVGVGEGEGETERSIERWDQDGDSGENHRIVEILRIVRLQPDGHTPPEVLDSLQIDKRLPHGEGDGLRGEYHGMGRTHRSTNEAKVLGVEGGGSLQTANLESDEVRAECGHLVSISVGGIR